MNESAIISDNFSWRRVGMLFRYWFPRFDYRIWIFPVVVLACGLLSLCFSLQENSPEGVTILSMAYYAIILGPLVFAGRRAPEIRATLPVKTSELYVFLLIVSLVIIPLVVSSLFELFAYCCGVNLTSEKFYKIAFAESEQLGLEFNFVVLAIYSILTYVVATVICLWGVVSAKNNPVGKPLLALVIGYFITGLSWGIFGAAVAISNFEEVSDADPEMMGTVVGSIINIGMYVMLPVLVIALIVFLRLIYRAIARKPI